MSVALAATMTAMAFTGCGNKSSAKLNDGSFKEVDASTLEFPLKEKATLTEQLVIRQIQNLNRIRERFLKDFRKRRM